MVRWEGAGATGQSSNGNGRDARLCIYDNHAVAHLPNRLPKCAGTNSELEIETLRQIARRVLNTASFSAALIPSDKSNDTPSPAVAIALVRQLATSDIAELRDTQRGALKWRWRNADPTRTAPRAHAEVILVPESNIKSRPRLAPLCPGPAGRKCWRWYQ